MSGAVARLDRTRDVVGPSSAHNENEVDIARVT